MVMLVVLDIESPCGLSYSVILSLVLLKSNPLVSRLSTLKTQSMAFQSQLNNIKLYRLEQIEDSLETVNEILNTVTALDQYRHIHRHFGQ